MAVRMIVLAVAGAAMLGACSGGSTVSSSGGAQSMAGEFYMEESAKGRTYVFGTEKSHQAFKASQQLPNISVTFVGAGVNGETVVLEADAKSPALQERIKAEFNRRHGSKLR